MDAPSHRSAWRKRLYAIIFESDTRAGQIFDVVLITLILASVGAVMLESVEDIDADYGETLRLAEWGFTFLFTLEYVLRLLCAHRPGRYATSFFGVVDFLAVVPTYISVLVPGAQFLSVVRLLRVLRVFRVLKLAAYLGEANFLLRALRESRRKITVFLFAVLTMVVIVGTLMYLIEGPEHGFTSIPRAVYWAIVTLTTVGFGDISPQTNLGQALAAVLMISGFGIIAVPTGIVTSEMLGDSEEDGADAKRKAHEAARDDVGDASQSGGTEDRQRNHPPERSASTGDANGRRRTPRGSETASASACPGCTLTDHDADAVFCKRCGTRLAQTADDARPATGA